MDVLLHINRRKLFVAFEQEPFSFSIFSLESVSRLVMKSVQGFNEHDAKITHIDSDYP